MIRKTEVTVCNFITFDKSFLTLVLIIWAHTTLTHDTVGRVSSSVKKAVTFFKV